MLSFFSFLFIVIIIWIIFVKVEDMCCGNERRAASDIQHENVRQAPIYTITTDPRGNDNTSNFTDFFWNVPSQNLRASEIAKDDKDLPSYEEVMRMEMERQVITSATTTTTPNTTETVPPPSVRLPPV